MNNIHLNILGSATFSNILNEIEFNNILSQNNISSRTDKKILVKILFVENFDKLLDYRKHLPHNIMKK